ncbi:MAG: FAD-dependent monooxygenase, partial [bacterium]
ELLRILQERARGLGVDLRFGHEVGDLAAFAGYDLIVAADGVNSLVRRELTETLRPSVHIGRSRFIWLGTTKVFDALTFLFEESEHGWFGVHAYPYSAAASTVIVETDEVTWRRAGFERYADAALAPGASDLRSVAYCQALFARHLNGHALLANNSKWLNFRTVRNRFWHARNAVILGDAAHTAHFSVGSGTRMAIEDAIALARALADHGDLESALTAYAHERQPAVRRIQQAAEPSRRWWESFRHWTHFGPEQFAFHHLARTRLLTYGTLKVRDERAVGEVEAWFARSNGTGRRAARKRTTHERPAAVSPLLTPLRLGDVRFPNRLVAVGPRVLGEGEGLRGAAERPTARVGDGAGLLLVGPAHGRAGHRSRPQTRGPAGLYLRNTAADGGPDDSTAGDVRLARSAARAGFDLLAVECTPSQSALARLAAVRKAWPAGRPLCVHIRAWSDPEDNQLVDTGLEFARALKAGHADLVAVSGPTGLAARDTERARVAQIYTSDLIRNVAGLPTMIIGGLYSVGDLTALILAGRADMCGWPALAWPGWRSTAGRAAAHRRGRKQARHEGIVQGRRT